jgi:hypothetical protein
MALSHLSRLAGDRDLEDVLCQVDGDGRRLHFGLLHERHGSATLALDAVSSRGGVHSNIAADNTRAPQSTSFASAV